MNSITTAVEYTRWRAIAESGDIDAAILSYIRQFGPTTFFKLKSVLSPYYLVDGTRSLTVANPQVYVWIGMSSEFADSIKRLIAECKLFLHPANVLQYIWEGSQLIFPIVSPTALKTAYDSPHWFPVVIGSKPYSEGA